MTGSMVFEVTRLRFHIKAHTGENEHKSRHLIMKGADRYEGRQQGCPTIERRIMATKDNGRDHNDQEENNNRRK